MTTPTEGFRPETAVAIGAVEQALSLARRALGASEVGTKGDGDVVTAADLAAEDAIRGILRESMPFPVAGEERGGEPPTDGSPYWLVDPICGTRNFAYGIPLYCVNVALVEDGRITVGVVSDASTGEVDVAERGRGAWALKAGGKRMLAPSEDSRTVVIEDSHSEGARRERAAQYTASFIRADRWELRSLSSTLALPYVAAGRVAAYVLFWTSALHVGAGSLLASEAGAVVTDIDGSPWTIHSDSIVASATRDLHEALLGL